MYGGGVFVVLVVNVDMDKLLVVVAVVVVPVVSGLLLVMVDCRGRGECNKDVVKVSFRW